MYSCCTLLNRARTGHQANNRRRGLEEVKTLLDGDSQTEVLLVDIAFDEAADHVHGRLRTLAERFPFEQMADEDSREDVACTVEGFGYLVVVEAEVRSLVDALAEAGHRLLATTTENAGLTIDASAGN